MSNLPKAGQHLPELKALTASGAPTSVEAHLGSWITLVNFLHGTWCPDCVSQLYRLQRRRLELTAAGVEAVMLVRDKPETLAAFLLSARPSLECTVLADPTGAAYQRVGAGGHTMMLVVGPDRTLRRIVHWGDRHEQPSDASLLQFLQEIGASPEVENLPATPAQ